MKKEKIERGIWCREIVTLTSNDDPSEFKAHLSREPRNEEERVTEFLLDQREIAKSTIVEAGYPNRECIYSKNDDGTWLEHKKDEPKPIGVTTYMWPFFPDIEQLTESEAARNVISRIDNLFLALHLGGSPWVIADIATDLFDPYRMLLDETLGVADAAVTGIGVRKGASAGGREKARLSAEQHSLWQLMASKIWERRPKLRNRSVAEILRKKLNNPPTAKHIARYIKRP